MTPNLNILKELINHKEGQIILNNMKSSLRFNLIKKDILEEYLLKCEKQYDPHSCKTIDDIIVLMNDIAYEYSFVNSSLTKLSEHKTYCNILSYDSFYYMLDIDSQLKVQNLRDEYYSGLLELKKIDLEGFFSSKKLNINFTYDENNKCLGNYGYFWVTDYEYFTKELRKYRYEKNLANYFMASLGLYHYYEMKEEIELVIIKFRNKKVCDKFQQRPTVLNGIPGKRFKVLNKYDLSRFNKKWGRTVNLDKLNLGVKDVEGAPERIVERTESININEFEFRFLGKILKSKEHELPKIVDVDTFLKVFDNEQKFNSESELIYKIK